MLTPWNFNGKIVEEIPKNAVGFVYIIQSTVTKRAYIGKKLFMFSKKIKGKKHTIESDWKTYFGSNEELKLEPKKEEFNRIILHICYSKTECNFLETLEIISSGALFSDEYYNNWVSCKITKKHIQGALKKHNFNYKR